MTGKTHLSIGFASGVGVAYVTQVDNWFDLLLVVIIAGVSALIPDMDTNSSKINQFFFAKVSESARVFALVSIGGLLVLYQQLVPDIPLWTLLIGVFLIVAAIAPHRTITHSVWACLYFAWVMDLLMPEYAVVAVVGYGSHIIADMLTVSGVPLLWPLPFRVSLKQIGVNIQTGKDVDLWMGNLSYVLAIVGAIYLMI